MAKSKREGDIAQLRRNASFIARKLARLRRERRDQSPYIREVVGDRTPHEVTRRNPAFDAYESLLREYRGAVRLLSDMEGVAAGDAETLDGMMGGSPLRR